jgi:ABC-2 type transport system permease protein
MFTAWTLATKDLRMLVRDRTAMFFSFIFPVLFAAFFGLIFSGGGEGGGGGGQRLAVTLVDLDRTPESSAFIERMRAGADVEVFTSETREAARSEVLAGRRLAYVVLPAGFAESQQRLFVGGSATLEVGVDPSRKAEAGMLQGVLMKHGFMGLAEVMQDPARTRQQLAQVRSALAGAKETPGMNRMMFEALLAQADNVLRDLAARRTATAGAAQPGQNSEAGGFAFQPVKFAFEDVVVARSGPTNAFAITFPQGIIWGIMGAASGFAVSLVGERSGGTLARLRLAPIGRTHILLGKALACFVTTLGVILGLLVVAIVVPIFAVRPVAPVMLAVAILSTCVCFVGLMMLLATIGRSERAAGGIGWAIMMVLAMIGGAAVPLFVMPGWMQTLSHVSPMKWAILALEGGLWRGFTPAQMALPCGILLGVGVAGFAIGTRLFAWEDPAK